MLIPVKDVKDEMFASAAMGNGVGILSEDGKIYAPFDAVAEAVFPTGHAVALSVIRGLKYSYIGVDTVQMDERDSVFMSVRETQLSRRSAGGVRQRSY